MPIDERQLSLEIIGDVEGIDPTNVISDKFQKQELHLVASDNPQYEQCLTVEAKQEKCDSLFDGLQVGDRVKVRCNLRGRKVDKNDGNPPRYFNSIECWGIEKLEKQPGYAKDDIPF
tara:strand:+ start:12554 stop:12904 length:351 start_codon:yes stop_codon:yes gene_type:complete